MSTHKNMENIWTFSMGKELLNLIEKMISEKLLRKGSLWAGKYESMKGSLWAEGMKGKTFILRGLTASVWQS